MVDRLRVPSRFKNITPEKFLCRVGFSLPELTAILKIRDQGGMSRLQVRDRRMV